MQLKTRRRFLFVEERLEEAGRPAQAALRKVGVVAVVENPFAGRYVDDLGGLVEASAELARGMAGQLLTVIKPEEIQSFGKGGIVGTAGEQEHANALLTTVFAEPLRKVLGGGKAWISSMTKIGAPGAAIDIPMNHREDIYVRSHYDGMSLCIPDAPQPDEIAVIFCVANRGRLNARVGGLTHEEVMARG